MVSSPPGSLVQRTWRYTALGLAAVFFSPTPAEARYVLQDDAPPVVAYSIDGTAGTNGWYVGSASGRFIVVHWSVSGSITSTTGCEPAIRVDDPNTGTTRTCTASGPGGTTSVTTKLLKVDATAPSTSVAPSRAPNGAGWYRAAVMLQWSGSDATSGIASCSQRTYSGPDAASTSQTSSCTDNAGNSSNASLTLHYDSTPPTVAVTPARPADHDGWYNRPVSISWSGTDATSGIDSCSATLTYSGPDAASVQPSGACSDKAGNTSPPIGFGFRFDATPPTGVAVVPERPPDHGGWYNRPFAVRWSGSDALSGIASCTTATYGGPTNGATALTGSCTDQAGNTSGSVGYSFKYDSAPPAFDGLSLTALDKIVTARWRTSGASVFKVTRKPGFGTAASSVVYEGPASSFADRRVKNYVRYAYLVTAEDAAGNELARTAAATPMPVLFAPRPGTRVGAGSSPLFVWRPAKKATYYNLQLWLRGDAVGSWWPARPRLKLSSRWRFGGSPHTLEQGSYTWYVWPGRGSRRLGKYGRLLGKSTFVVGT